MIDTKRTSRHCQVEQSVPSRISQVDVGLVLQKGVGQLDLLRRQGQVEGQQTVIVDLGPML